MGVKPNATNEGTSAPLYTGVTLWKVVGVNPTQEQLKALGYKAEKTPSYHDPNSGHRVTFFLEGKAGSNVLKANVSYFLKDKKMENVFINKQGKFGKDRTQITGEIRNPYDGEIGLLNFISDWCNVKKDEEVFLESIDAIVKSGDVHEIREIFANAKENVFKALAVVRQGKYQGIYEKKLMRSWSTDLSYLHKSLADNQEYLKDEIGPVDLKLFVPEQFDLRPYTRVAVAQASSNGQEVLQQDAQGTEEPQSDDTPF